MSRIEQKSVIDLHPEGTPPPMSRLRRLVCVLIGAPAIAFGLYIFTSPRVSGLTLLMGATLVFFGVSLALSGIFPTFSLQKLNRRRWR